MTLVAFETLAVATIMPIVAAELGSRYLYGWVFAAFFLGSLLGIVVVGALIDRRGLTRPFVVGVALFSAGLAIGGLAPSMEILVAGRFVQGLGAGAIPTVAYVAIGRGLPDELRAKMFATLSTAWVVPALIGPAISGVVAESVGWRFVFLGLLPGIAVAGAMTLPAIARSVPTEDVPGEGPAAAGLRALLPSALLVTIGAGLIVAGLTDATLVPGVPIIVAGVVVGLPAFKRLTPVGTLSLRPGLPAAVLLRGLLTFAFFCADAYVPLALQDWRGVGAAVSGIALTAATLAWTVGAWIQARRWIQIGARRFVTVGFLLLGVAIAGFASVLSPAVPVAVAITAWAFAGLAMGMSYSPLSLVVLAEAPPAEQGTATSGLQLSDVLGTALGTGVGGAMLVIAARAGLQEWVGLAAAFAVGVVAALVGVGLARRLPGPGGAATRLTAGREGIAPPLR